VGVVPSTTNHRKLASSIHHPAPPILARTADYLRLFSWGFLAPSRDWKHHPPRRPQRGSLRGHDTNTRSPNCSVPIRVQGCPSKEGAGLPLDQPGP